MKSKLRHLIFSAAILLLFITCERDNIIIDESDLLTGFWINPQATDTLITYERAGSLKENDYCFSFQSNGRFTERKNAGWCGTPPVVYSDFEGSWQKNDSIVTISVAFWGGTAQYRWKIKTIDKERLTIVSQSTEYFYEDL